MDKKSLPNSKETIIETVDVDGTYQEELRKKEERRNYPSKPVLYERRFKEDRRHKDKVDIKI
ncbi:hypothetical protein [Aliivibrio sifiae]|uniref:Uncharacterized protein n=1 Tax=Aliivibrio sifiae TaxID=566293 RepID=A0A2S7X986_9GAMM|nr:hypothetical protein [Aliivibrio sifiae]PQJ87706.1 hypothetical protein BTO23_16570 [Aliivibrio sifiae]GLR73331.1 hypothetical protein GCM10007855_02040 [Aliivibrio sifiae]